MKAVKAAHRLQVRVAVQDSVVRMTKDGEEKVIANTKDLLQFLKSFTRPKWHQRLTAQAFKGHSFPALKENPQSNFFFSPRHPQVNDNVLKFIFKARTNNLPTGEVLSHGKGEVPRCQRCAHASDTLMHRLNGCRPLYSRYKARHNKVEAIVVEAIKSTTNQRLQINRSTRITMPGCPELSPENRAFLPDVWYFDRVNNHLKIIEITVPYDSIDDTGSTKLSQRRQEKLEKYAGLVDEIRREWNVATHFHVIVVSSLGTVPKETVRELRQLLGGDPKLVNSVTRSLALNAARESALIYWGIRADDAAENHVVNPADIVQRNHPVDAGRLEDVDRLFQGSSEPEIEEVDGSDAAPPGEPSDTSAHESDDSHEPETD